MMKMFHKKSKKGITLVESVIAVVLLGFAATGILTLLISSGTKILQIGGESSAYSEATQKMDFIISAISNGSNPHDSASGSLDIAQLLTDFSAELDGISEGNVTQRIDWYPNSGEYSPAAGDEIGDYIRGWYLELEYNGITVNGFAANSEGVFDNP